MDREAMNDALALARTTGLAAAAARLGNRPVRHMMCANHHLYYVDLGEPYGDTICVEDGRICVDTWGDWLEQTSRDSIDEAMPTGGPGELVAV